MEDADVRTRDYALAGQFGRFHLVAARLKQTGTTLVALSGHVQRLTVENRSGA
jgi:hypothetical protein